MVSASPFSKKLEVYIASPTKFCEYICNDNSITLYDTNNVSDDDDMKDSECNKSDSITLSKELSDEIANKSLGKCKKQSAESIQLCILILPRYF